MFKRAISKAMSKRGRKDGGIRREDYEHQERLREARDPRAFDPNAVAGSWQDQKVGKEALARRKIVKVRRKRGGGGGGASMVSAVARNDSPLFTDDVLTDTFNVSADSRLAATSNDNRVRVESS